MEHLAEHIFKEFYQKQIMEKPGMRITSSYNGFYTGVPQCKSGVMELDPQQECTMYN